MVVSVGGRQAGALPHHRARQRRKWPGAAADPLELPAQAFRRHRADRCHDRLANSERLALSGKNRQAAVSRLPFTSDYLTESDQPMRIVVCVKQVPDPEAAFSMFKVDEQAKKVIPAPGLQWVMSPFDEQAVEAALRIRKRHADTRITVLSMGLETARNAIKHGLAMGADDGVLLSDAAFEDADSYATAYTLAGTIRKLGGCDLVLTGRQAADWDAGVVGAGIGELLGVPVISFAMDIQVENGIVRVERVLDDGAEIVE